MSVGWNVVQAAKSLLVAAMGTRGTVVVRKYMQHDKADEQDNRVVLVLDKPRKGELSMPRKVDMLYPVLVGIVQKHSLRQVSDQWLADTYELVRYTLWVTTLPGVATVRDCDFDDNASGESSTWGDGRYDVTFLKFTYHSHEGRNG